MQTREQGEDKLIREELLLLTCLPSCLSWRYQYLGTKLKCKVSLSSPIFSPMQKAALLTDMNGNQKPTGLSPQMRIVNRSLLNCFRVKLNSHQNTFFLFIFFGENSLFIFIVFLISTLYYFHKTLVRKIYFSICIVPGQLSIAKLIGICSCHFPEKFSWSKRVLKIRNCSGSFICVKKKKRVTVCIFLRFSIVFQKLFFLDYFCLLFVLGKGLANSAQAVIPVTYFCMAPKLRMVFRFSGG